MKRIGGKSGGGSVVATKIFEGRLKTERPEGYMSIDVLIEYLEKEGVDPNFRKPEVLKKQLYVLYPTVPKDKQPSMVRSSSLEEKKDD